MNAFSNQMLQFTENYSIRNTFALTVILPLHLRIGAIENCFKAIIQMLSIDLFQWDFQFLIVAHDWKLFNAFE